MTLLTNSNRSLPLPIDLLSSDLVDGIAEAVASPPEAQGRADAICSIVREIYETLEWVHGPDSKSSELASLRGLVAAALEHQERMSVETDPPRLSA